MKTLKLFRVGESLFGVDQELVSGIVGRHNEKVQIEVHQNQETLLLSKGRKAAVYDLMALFFEEQEEMEESNPYLLVLQVESEFIALQIPWVGGQISVAEEHLRPLPPIFGPEAKTIFPHSLVNGTETVLILDPGALHSCFSMM